MKQLNKKIRILGLLFTIIVGVTFSYGIFRNPTFNIHEFCANLSSEFIGWILAVTIFQYYFDAKMAAKNTSQNSTNAPVSTADEIVKFKNLLDLGVITQEEFEHSKKRLLLP